MAIKTYPHAVIWHGELIPANTPIEVKEEKPEEQIKSDEIKEEKPKKRGAK